MRTSLMRLVRAMSQALSWDGDRTMDGVFAYVDGTSRALVGCIAVERIDHAWEQRCAQVSLPSTLPITPATHHLPTCMFRYLGGAGVHSRCDCSRQLARATRAVETRTNDATSSSSSSTTPPRSAQYRVRSTLGVQRLWVHPAHRRRGVASRLLAVVSREFVLGHRISRSAVAFTGLTAEGRAFARAFCGETDVRIYC